MSNPDSDDVRSLLIAAREERDELQRRYDALYDLPLCRLQLPDGTVPSCTEEALEAWHRVAMDALQQVRVLSPGGTFAWKYQAEQLESQLTALRQEHETMGIEVETLRTLLNAWQKRAYEAERANGCVSVGLPLGEPVDPARLAEFKHHMETEVIPSIVRTVQERQRAAAVARNTPPFGPFCSTGKG